MRSHPLLARVAGLAVAAAAAATLAGCDEASTGADDLGIAGSARASHPLSAENVALMDKEGVSPSSPVLIRTYKKEAEFEIWKMKPDGRYVLFRTFPMCRWSGQLGPKLREGDRQVPEGFYKITPGQMNPNSHYYLSFNVGYPNAYDRAYGASGSSVMVHGACSSAGCFSMTDAQIDQIYAVAREAFNGGQSAIQMQSYPFRMTAENLAKYRDDANIGFWRQLKEGSDNFEVSRQDVTVGVCGRHYVFNTTARNLDPVAPCPALQHDGIQNEVAAREAEDDAKIAKLDATIPAVRTIYADGGQNSFFAHKSIADVSRPEALATGSTDWLVGPAARSGAASTVKVASRATAKTGRSNAEKSTTLAKAKAPNPAVADKDDRTGTIRKSEGSTRPQAAL